MLPLMPPGQQDPGMMPAGPPPLGAPMPGGPIPLPPPPAAQAGMAAMSLVPQQTAEQLALQQKQQQELLGLLASQLSSQPNPAAEAAQGMPAQMVTPDGGPGTAPDPNDPTSGGY